MIGKRYVEKMQKEMQSAVTEGAGKLLESIHAHLEYLLEEAQKQTKILESIRSDIAQKEKVKR